EGVDGALVELAGVGVSGPCCAAHETKLQQTTNVRPYNPFDRPSQAVMDSSNSQAKRPNEMMTPSLRISRATNRKGLSIARQGAPRVIRIGAVTLTVPLAGCGKPMW